MRTSWLMISLAVHGAAITAALGFGAYARVAAARPPARIAVENRVASAPSSVPVVPLPDVVVEPVVEVRPLREQPPEPLPELVAQAPVADPQPAPESAPRSTPSMTLQRATLERVRQPVPQPVALPVPVPQPPPAAEPQAAPPAEHVEAKARSDNEPPRYPDHERRLGCEGTVVVAVAIDATGAVREVSLREASRYAGFNREALRAVRRWRFEPALERGVPVPSETDIEVVFRLRDR